MPDSVENGLSAVVNYSKIEKTSQESKFWLRKVILTLLFYLISVQFDIAGIFFICIKPV